MKLKLITPPPNVNYGFPVLVDDNGTTYRAVEITPNGQTGEQYVKENPDCGPHELIMKFLEIAKRSRRV